MDIAELIRPNILTLEAYHSAREMIQEGVLLDANENPYSQEWQGIGLAALRQFSLAASCET